MKFGRIEDIYGKITRRIIMKIKCKKGSVSQAPVVKPGRPKQKGSYRQRFFAALDDLDVLEYLEVEADYRDKAQAYCYQKNIASPGKHFIVNSLKAGAVRIIREK